MLFVTHLQAVLFRISLPLAQIPPWDESPPAPPKTPARPMSFSDLQQGMRAYNAGETDNTLRNGLLILMAAVALLTLILHTRQKRKTAEPPDSLGRLARELVRQVRFPIGTKVLLLWVARSTRIPFASLMLSSSLFDKSVTTWASQPTFGVARQWGQGRLSALRRTLFG